MPGLLLLVARELVDHDPPRVLAWRLLHEPRLADLPAWLRPFLPTAPVLDRDPIALVLASIAILLALLYLGAVVSGRSPRVRGVLIGVGSALLVGLPTVAFVAMGAATDRPYGQDGGVVQLPLALEKVLRGESPYAADYSGTVLARQARASAFWEPLGGNPILRHHAYLPGTHLVMLPAYLVSRAVLGFFDPRLVTLLFYAAAIGLAYRIPEREDARLAAAGLVAFNPLTWWQQVFGANDIVFVALLLLVVLLNRQGRGVAAGACLGLACATKQLAWPFAPFLLAGLSGAGSLGELASPPALRRLRGPALAAGLTFALVVLPVVALDPAAFYADIVQYNLGLPGGDNYPLGGTPGIGFANFLVGYGGVTSLREHFPFGRFYLLFIPLGLLLLARQLRRGRPEAALVMGSAALFASIYFSRVVHPNYLIPAAILLPIGLLALREGADIALVPLGLAALAVTVSEQEVFRSVWEQAVVAQVPEVLPGFLRTLLPHPAPGLTTDPIGLVLSAACAGLGLVALLTGVLGARPAVRGAVGIAALVVAVGIPAYLVTTIGSRTGTPRGLDGWVAQLPADADRLRNGGSPYAPPPAERPVARDAWSFSFRQDPPAERRPSLPLWPPGGSVLGALGGSLGARDPRFWSLVALFCVVGAAARRWAGAPGGLALGAGIGLLLPLSFGVVFGAGGLWVAGGLALAAAASERGRGTLAALVLGATVAIDPRALAGAPLLALDPALRFGRSLRLAAVGYAAVTVPVLLLDPAAFASTLAAWPEAGPGLGLVNLLFYRGAPAVGTVAWLHLAAVTVAAVGVVWLWRSPRGDAWSVSAFLSLAVLWLDPAPPAGILVVPVVLLALGAGAQPPRT